MALKEYTLATPAGETTVLLDAEDAERYGDRVKPLSRTKRGAAVNKAAVVDNKAADGTASQSKRDEAVARSFGQK